MNFRVLALLGFWLFTGCDIYPWPIHGHASGIQVWIAWGQSNMNGILQSTEFPIDSNVQMYFGPRKGPAYPFGIELHRKTLQPVVIIQCAEPGTSITEWQPGSTLYNRCLSRVAQSGMDHVDGIIGYQGETDAELNPPPVWHELFQNMIDGFKKDLKVTHIIYTKIGYLTPDFHFTMYIRDQQYDADVDAAGLATVDGVHLTPEAYKILGQQLADRS